MNAKTLTTIIVLIALGVGAFYFWPMMATAPSDTSSMEQTSQTQNEETYRDPMMSGTWRSNTDAKFTREMRQDGVIIDRYEGEASAGINGTWSVVDPGTEVGLTVPAESLQGMTVIKVVWEGGVETTYFAVNALSETSLTTTDLSGRSAVTVYTKVQ